MTVHTSFLSSFEFHQKVSHLPQFPSMHIQMHSNQIMLFVWKLSNQILPMAYMTVFYDACFAIFINKIQECTQILEKLYCSLVLILGYAWLNE